MTEKELWAAHDARQAASRFEAGFKWAYSVLLALVFGFDAWLIWLIWFRT